MLLFITIHINLINLSYEYRSVYVLQISDLSCFQLSRRVMLPVISCNMCTCDFPDMCAINLWAPSIYIRQIIHVHVTTIAYTIGADILLCNSVPASLLELVQDVTCMVTVSYSSLH